MTQEQIPATAPEYQVNVRLPEKRPQVTYILLGVTISVYIAQMASIYFLGGDLPGGLGVKSNADIIQGEWWRLFTPMFLHSTQSILHIGFNMYALYVIGPNLERFYGHARFLCLYLLSGFAGNVISFLFSPALSLGASTAIFGMLAGEAIFIYRNRKIFGAPAQRALINIVVIAGINFVIGLSPGIDNFGHLGVLAGLAFAWFGGPVLGMIPSQSSGQMEFALADTRSQKQTILAGVGVGIAFIALAVLKIIFL